ncbi:lipopolysaccharide kinase InaA family protein [Lentisphaerota bacterium WC36G]|nr:lipopolysaccharide kinase InaA family protein [Lentisphaerae bacterium WC36]
MTKENLENCSSNLIAKKFTMIKSSPRIEEFNHSEFFSLLESCQYKEFQQSLSKNSMATILKNSRSTLAFIYQLHNNRKVFFKVYRRIDFKYQLRYLMRQSRAAKSFDIAEIYLKSKVNTPTPIYAVEKRKFGLLKYSVVVNEVVENLYSCDELFNELAQHYQDDFFELFLRNSLKIIVKFHDQNLIHGDLKISNLYYKKDENLTTGIWDFDGSTIKYQTATTTKEREIDLCRFVASVCDGLIKRNLKLDVKYFYNKINFFYNEFYVEKNFNINNQEQTLKKYRKTS